MDGTLLDAWASMKSFKTKDPDDSDGFSENDQDQAGIVSLVCIVKKNNYKEVLK